MWYTHLWVNGLWVYNFIPRFSFRILYPCRAHRSRGEHALVVRARVSGELSVQEHEVCGWYLQHVDLLVERQPLASLILAAVLGGGGRRAAAAAALAANHAWQRHFEQVRLHNHGVRKRRWVHGAQAGQVAIPALVRIAAATPRLGRTRGGMPGAGGWSNDLHCGTPPPSGAR